MDVMDVVFAFINILLAIPTIFINLFVLVAVIQTTQLHTPAHVLVWNLALADLGVGLFTQPTFITSISINKPLKMYIDLLVLVFGGISLIGVTLILLDRYVALLLHLRYPVLITTRKAVFLVLALWISGLFLPWPMYILIPSNTVELIGTIGAFICFITWIAVYCKMYRIIRRHRNQIKAQTMTGNSTEIAQKARAKSIRTSFWVQFVFILCWLPLVLVTLLKLCINRNFSEKIFTYLFRFSLTVFLSKSLANPILYCWRVREIRTAVFKISKKLGVLCYRNEME